MAKVYPNLVVYGPDGKPSAVAYQELPALLLAQAQKQQQIRELQAENRRLKPQAAQIAGLQHRLAKLESGG